MATTTKLFEKSTETAGTIEDTTMRLAYGKAETPTLNITFASFVTWLITQLASTFMKRSNNLSDVTSATTARTNISAANRYLTHYTYSSSGGSLSNPQIIQVDPSKYDVILLSAGSDAYYQLPSPTDSFSGASNIVEGTIIRVKPINSTQTIKIKDSNTEESSNNIRLGTGGCATWYWDSTYSTWRNVSAGLRYWWV